MEATKEKHATFTPGPWHAFEQCSYSATKGLFEIDANHPSGNRQTVAVTPFAGDGHELWANARLIAAAPAMYEVLQELEESMELAKKYGYEKEHAMIREVLAKVEGGEG